MTVLLAWLVYPLGLALSCLGLGLIVERVAGRRLPASLLLPIGFAGLLSVCLTITATPYPGLLSPVLLMTTAAGFILRDRSWPLRDRLLGQPWALAAPAVVFLIYMLPIVMTGTATFAGWIKLDDGATWLALGDQLATAGRTLEGLFPSTREALLADLWGGAQWQGYFYPSASFAPLGYGSVLLRVPGTALIQPYEAFMAAVMACSLLAVLRRVMAPSPRLRAIWVMIAAQPALLYGYAMWGGVKEVALAALLPAAGVVVVLAAARRVSGWLAAVRVAAPLAVLTTGCLAIGGYAAAAWFLVPLGYWAVATARRSGALGLARAAAAALGLVLVLTAVDVVRLRPDGLLRLGSFAAGSTDIGTLWGKLLPQQVVGIWLTGDFRAMPARMDLTWILIVVVVALAGGGVVRAVRRRAPELPLYVAGVVPLALVFLAGGAWVGGKALAMASPVLLTAAGAGVGWMWAAKRKVEAAVVAAVVSAGVLVGSALTFNHVWLAPADEMSELAAIGDGPQSWAPTVMTDFSPYGARYLLGHLNAQGAGELRRSVIPLRTGTGLDRSAYADIDEFDPRGLAEFHSLVLRRSPTASRPPSNYVAEHVGEQYELWHRIGTVPTPSKHVPFGTWEQATARPDCATIDSLGREAAGMAPGTVLQAATRSPAVSVDLTDGDVPQSWVADPTNGSVRPQQPGTATYTFDVPEGGTHPIFLRGGYQGRITVAIDGREVFTDAHRLQWSGHGVLGPDVEMSSGRHTMTVTYDTSWWQPGSGKFYSPNGSGPWAWPVGPVVWGPTATDTAMVRVTPKDARDLCQRYLDWVEIIPTTR